jgi:transposase
MRKERKHFTPEEKVAILRRHLVDKIPVSELCEELGLRPTVFYRWQKELFENGAAAFQSQERPQRQVEEKQKRIVIRALAKTSPQNPFGWQHRHL